MEQQTKYILIAAQKGGQGKSTLAMALASRLHYIHQKKVVIIDADDHQRSIFRKRSTDLKAFTEPETLYDILPFNNPDRLAWVHYLQPLEGSVDFIIIDTGGTMRGSEKPFLIKLADLIIVPVISNELDVDSFQIFMDALDGNIEKTVVIRNFYRPRNPDQQYFDHHFKDQYPLLDSVIKKRDHYSRLPLTVQAAKDEDFKEFTDEILDKLRNG